MEKGKEMGYQKIADMAASGLPFDMVWHLFITPEKLGNELTIRKLVGEIYEGSDVEIYKLALIALAYYEPVMIGLKIGTDINEKEEE